MEGSKINTLLIIDPQYDFCNPNGALYVNGADADMKRLADVIDTVENEFEDIVVTLDTHNIVDIAHPIWWIDVEGNSPAPFTIITKDDVDNKKWIARDPLNQEWSEVYVAMLARNNKYSLCIWPEHCIRGTIGNTIEETLNTSLINWERNTLGVVNTFTKGENIMTEHYSAVKADVEIDTYPTTKPNYQLIKTLDQAELIFIAGEALSHCVANTVRDLMDYINPIKFVLIRDTMSNVTGFEHMGDEFIQEFKARGGGITTTQEMKNAVNG